jgi:large subunit ribosomal protein L4
MLSVKLAQDDLHIVSDLNIPADDPSFINELIAERIWGPSVLIVDVDDIMPRNITAATDEIPHVNLMPAYGLNVYSMLKHETLVLTEAAAEYIEDKILSALNSSERHKKYRLDQV